MSQREQRTPQNRTKRTARVLATGMEVGGLGLAIYGIYLFSFAAACVVGGLLLISIALLVEWGNGTNRENERG